MGEKKKYIVKRFGVNPFSKNLKGDLIICDGETLEPFCDIEFGEEHVKDGDILMEGSFEARWCSKRIKHVVVGDTVHTRTKDGIEHDYIGTVESVTFDEDDFYLKSMVKVKDIRLSEQGKFFKVEEPKITEKTFALNDLCIASWITATIKCPHCGR